MISTEQKYIRSYDINGIYTNSKADRKKASLRFLIDGQTRFNFKLYEEGETVRGKDIYYDDYEINVKDDNDKEYKLGGINKNDRVKLYEEDSKKLHNLLLSNKKLRFYIIRDNDDNTTEYSFTIDCTGYERVFRRFEKENPPSKGKPVEQKNSEKKNNDTTEKQKDSIWLIYENDYIQRKYITTNSAVKGTVRVRRFQPHLSPAKIANI